jgi:hypothetical protein
VELVQVLDLAVEVLGRRSLGGGANDRAALAQVDLADLAPQPIALLVVQAA